MIDIKGLNFSYVNQTVFEDFSFSSSAKTIAFKGPSGCGKSTLLSILAGNVKYDCNEFEFNQNNYLILQEDSLCPWLTGIDNISKFSREKPELERNELYQYVAPYINKYASQMSFGQRRMVEILRALVFCPQVLMLDEPFNYIDSNGRKLIAKALNNFVSMPASTLIITSHYQEDHDILKPETYLFDGLFPIKRLTYEENL